MSAVDRAALENLARDALLAEARRTGVRRPEVMTRVELVDEVLRLGTPNPVERKKVRGWLGVARDLLASAVERGLNLPDAAALIRGDVRYEPLNAPERPVATVTLAEIYGAQGHVDRALGMLDEVLSKEPEHELAGKLRARLERERTRQRASGTRPSAEPAVQHEPDEAEDAPTLVPPEDPEPVTARAGATASVPSEPRAVFTRRSDDAVDVYFEAGVPDGAALVVRLVEVRPTRAGAERVEHEVSVAGERGTVTLAELTPGSVVRAAVGRKEGTGFRALAVAAEIRSSRTGAGMEVAWAPRRGVDYLAVAARSVL